jgi:hypothetical protein
MPAVSWWYVPLPAEFQGVYRWWTVSVSRTHLKLGPVAWAWYPWFDGRRHLDMIVLSRVGVTVPGWE